MSGELDDASISAFANFVGAGGIAVALGVASLFISSFYILACWKERYSENDRLQEKKAKEKEGGSAASLKKKT